jgi:hypothetical protein
MGISYDQSHRYQTMASMPEVDFEQHIADTKAEGRPLTSAGVYRQAQHLAAVRRALPASLLGGNTGIMDRAGLVGAGVDRSSDPGCSIYRGL